MKMQPLTLTIVFFLCLPFYHSDMIQANQLEPLLQSEDPVLYQHSTKDSSSHVSSKPTINLCMESCKKRNQRIAVGVEVIMENCQRYCIIELARRMIQSDAAEVKTAGIKLLCDLSDQRTVNDLIRLLKEDLVERTGIWAEIIPALGRIGDVTAIPILIKLAELPDEDWLGRQMAIEALGEIGNPSAMQTLITAFYKNETREAAVIALIKIKDKRAASVLVSAIQPEEDLGIREAATTGLIELGSDAVQVIHEEFTNYSPENPQTQKRVWLCEILGAINTKEAKQILQESSNSVDKTVAVCARQFL